MASRWKSRWFRIGAGTLLALVVLIAIAPRLVDIGPVRRMATSEIEAIFGHGAEVDEVAAGWTSGVRVRGISVLNPDDTFASARVMEAREFHLDQPLHQILWGGADRTKIRVTGLVLRVDEQCQGQTNVAQLLRGFFPRREAPPGAPAPAPHPVEISLRGATVEVRHMVPRRVKAVDPFRADPDIAALDEGTLHVLLEDFDLDAALDGPRSFVRFDGRVLINGRGGPVTAELRPGGSSLHAEGIDLSPLEPILNMELRGLLDLQVEKRDRINLRAGVRDFAARGIEEAKITLRAELDPGKRRIEQFSLTSGSGSLDLRASGSYGETVSLALEGHAPRALVLRPLGRELTGGGTVHVDLTATGTRDVFTLTGSTTISGVPPADVTTRVDLDYESAGLVIRRLTATAGDATLGVTGTLSLDAPLACDLSLTAHAELGLVQGIAASYRTFDGLALAGKLDLADCRVAVDGKNATVHARGTITDLDAVVDGEEIRHAAAQIDVEAEVSEDGNRVVVHRGKVLDCELTGFVEGLLEERPTAARLKGSIHLTALVARLLALDATPLQGTVGVDIEGQRDATGLRVSGTVKGAQLRVGDIARDDVLLTITEGGKRDGWHARARLEADGQAADLTLIELYGWTPRDGADAGGIRLRGRVVVEDAALESLLRGVRLPKGVELSGRAAPILDIGLKGGVWTADVTVPRTRLTALYRGNGARHDLVSFRGTIRHGDGVSRLSDAKLSVGSITVTPEGSLRRGPGGARTLHAHATLTATGRQLRRCVPQLDRIQLAGQYDVEATLTGGHWHGTLEGKRVRLVVAEGHLNADVIAADWKQGGAFTLRIDDRTSLAGHARLGETIDIDVAGGGTLPPWLPEAFAIKGGRVSLPPDGAFRIAGVIDAERVRVDTLRLTGVHADVALEGADRRELLDTLRGTVDLSARSVSVRGLVFDDVKADVRPRDSMSNVAGFKFTTTLSAAEITGDSFSATDLRIDAARAFLGDFRFEQRSFAIGGPVRLGELKAKGVAVRGARADVVWKERVASIDGFYASVNDGTLKTGRTNRLDFRQAVPRWTIDLDLKDATVNEDLGRALQFAIPLLVERQGRKRALRGKLEIHIVGAGAGLSRAALERSDSDAKADIVLRHAEIEGSAILNLLSARFAEARSGSTYRFDRIAVSPRLIGGRIRIEPFAVLLPRPLLKIRGEAMLDGRLAYQLQLSALRQTVEVTGNVDDPQLRYVPWKGWD